MLLAVAAVAIGFQNPTPPGWIDQKIVDGVTISAPRTLKKDPPDPKDKTADDSWRDGSGPVHYGVQIEKLDPKHPESEEDGLTGFVLLIADEIDGTIDGEKETLCQGWRGVAITLTGKDHRTVSSHAFFYKDRVVSVFVSYDSRSKRPESADPFLNSLRFATNGSATSPSPVLEQYQIADTGIWAGFPSKPDVLSGAESGKTIPARHFQYRSLLLSVSCFPAVLNKEEMSPDELRKASSDDIDSFLSDSKAKTLSQHDIAIAGDTGVCREYATSDGEAGTIVAVRHGKYIVLIEAVGPRHSDYRATIDAFFKSLRFADKASGGKTGPDEWTEQTIGDGIKISVLRKLTKEAPDSDPELAKAIRTWSDEDSDLSYQIQLNRSKESEQSSIGVVLSSFVQGLIQGAKGKIDGEKDLLLQGWPGVAVTVVTDSGATVVSRAYAYDGELVTLACGYPTSSGRPASIDRFLDSLHFPKDGTATSSGPQMAKYPLGESGISAMFPIKPGKQDKPINGKGFMKGVVMHVNVGLYCGRVYAVAYFDFPADAPPITPRDQTDFYNEGLDTFEAEAKATVTKQKEIKFGDDTGLYREYTAKLGVGSEAIVLHKKHAVIMFVLGPKAYGESASVDAFFKSLEFKD